MKEGCDVIIHIHRTSHTITQIDDLVGNLIVTLLLRHEGQQSLALREENFKVFTALHRGGFGYFEVPLLTTIVHSLDDCIFTDPLRVTHASLNRFRGKEIGERV